MAPFEYPVFYNFPPFFTIQPVEITRQKQLALWRQLLLSYTAAQKHQQIKLGDTNYPLFTNQSIQRRLTPADRKIVLDDLVASGHGEWKDATTVRVLQLPPAALATDIYTWAQSAGYIGQVCTVYELHSGEDVSGMSFEGIEEDVLRRALQILEDRGQCTLFKGETSQEDGIKFQ